ncbi:hypothetical protein Fcan01_00444 [Folsomia candida]|uniref:Gustatory receptor n=1 Tax=Folsomia candida TaxID=158441 RepID=A0A226EUK2_FOLCA|nr:hypothetical protein Fcan01_00444 [Folsomia candida]
MLLAFEAYSKWMQHFTLPPIVWFPEKTKFLFSTQRLKNYLWYFHTFIGLGFCSVGGLVVILLSQIFQFYLPLPAAYLFLLVVQLLSSASAAFAVNLGMILYGRECVKGWNTLLWTKNNFERKDRSTPGLEYVLRPPEAGVRSFFWRPEYAEAGVHVASRRPEYAEAGVRMAGRRPEYGGRRRRHPVSRRPVWITLTIFVWAFSTYPLLISLAAIYLNLDPFYHILSLLNITHPLAYMFRFYLIFTVPAELCRLLALIVLFSISAFQMVRNTLNALVQENSTRFRAIVVRMRGALVESQYRQVQITVVSMEELLDCICLFGQGLCLANGILCNFVTFKFYAILPIWFYAIFPCISVMILVIFHVLMPYLHDVFDNSHKLLEILSLFTTCQPKEVRKKSLKELRSLKKITISPMLAGYKFFIYARSAKVELPLQLGLTQLIE